MADHDRHSSAGQLFRDGARLLRIAGVVADLERQLLSKHAAGGIDVGDCLLGAVAHLSPEGRLAAGHRSGCGDRDILRVRRARGENRKERQSAQTSLSSYLFLASVPPGRVTACANLTLLALQFLARFRASQAAPSVHRAKDIAEPSGRPTSPANAIIPRTRKIAVSQQYDASESSSPSNRAK